MKKLFNRIRDFIKKIFGDSLEYLKRNSATAVKVTEVLKKYVESNIADVAVGLIPGDVDNVILIQLRKIVPEVTIKVALGHNIIQASTIPSEALGKIIEYLKSLGKEGRTAFWISFAAEVNMALADGKLTFTEAVILSQLAYKEFYEAKETA